MLRFLIVLYCMGVCAIFAVRILGVISWSWWVVTAFAYIPAIIAILVFACVGWSVCSTIRRISRQK
jgi:hypothetical protein